MNRFIKLDDVKKAQVLQFVGEDKAKYYEEKWLKMGKNNSKYSINFAALIFGPYWMLYRKMYTPAIIIILLDFVAFFTQLSLYSNNHPFATLLIKLSIHIFDVFVTLFFGLFGNYLYERMVIKKVKKIQKKHIRDSEEMIISVLNRVGGTNVKAVKIMIVSIITFYILFIFGLLFGIIF